MLPFPRDLDLNSILQQTETIMDQLATLCVRTPKEDPKSNTLYSALIEITNAKMRMMEVSRSTSG